MEWVFIMFVYLLPLIFCIWATITLGRQFIRQAQFYAPQVDVKLHFFLGLGCTLFASSLTGHNVSNSGTWFSCPTTVEYGWPLPWIGLNCFLVLALPYFLIWTIGFWVVAMGASLLLVARLTQRMTSLRVQVLGMWLVDLVLVLGASLAPSCWPVLG